MTTLPVATAVSGLTKTCLQTAVSLDSLRSKFPSADATISALCSECTQISASLTDVQMFVLTNDFDKRPELNDPFDTVLTACMVGYACLELRLKKLVSAPTANTSNSRTPWRVKAAAGWDEEAMRKYLGNLKGGKEALLVLVQLLPKPAEEVRTEVSQKEKLWLGMKATTDTLREHNPDITVPRSILPPPSKLDGPLATQSEAVENIIPVKAPTPVVDTKPYRRAMAIAQIQATIASPPQSPPREVDLIDFTEEIAIPTIASPKIFPLESMWNQDPLKPEASGAQEDQGQLQAAPESVFHTVRGPSSTSRANTSAHRASRSTSRHVSGYEQLPDRTKDTATSSPSQTLSTTNITSQPSLPISISPHKIQFTVPCSIEQVQTLKFTNPNPFPVTYKTSTTRPQSYAVRPNFVTLLPEQRIDVQFIFMEVLEPAEEANYGKRRDKFRVQSVPVTDVAHGNLFDWRKDKEGARIEEAKIKVELLVLSRGGANESGK